MGLFLSLSGIIGKSINDVADSLTKFALSHDGGLQQLDVITANDNRCFISESEENTTVVYPADFLEWENSSAFISKDLGAPVFSFHIHDEDLWMYVLYVNGEVKDRFNPIPDYWDDELTEEEILEWQGNADVVAKHISRIQPDTIERYLHRWDLESDEMVKAYHDDDFAEESWQLLDFMKKLGLPYPIDEKGNHQGKVYQLWTDEFPLSIQTNDLEMPAPDSQDESKTWWKFWN